jgi:hypothetical protein
MVETLTEVKPLAKAAPGSPDVMSVLGFRLHPSLIAALHYRAVAEGVQVSEIGRAAIAAYLEPKNEKTPDA